MVQNSRRNYGDMVAVTFVSAVAPVAPVLGLRLMLRAVNLSHVRHYIPPGGI